MIKLLFIRIPFTILYGTMAMILISLGLMFILIDSTIDWIREKR
jgi:hypothetical protein